MAHAKTIFNRLLKKHSEDLDIQLKLYEATKPIPNHKDYHAISKIILQQAASKPGILNVVHKIFHEYHKIAKPKAELSL